MLRAWGSFSVKCSSRFSCSSWPQVRHTSNASRSSTSISSGMLERARSIAAEHANLNSRLVNDYDVKLAKRIGELRNTTEALNRWDKANDSLKELQQLLADPSTDPELRSIASEEVEGSSQELKHVSTQLKKSLIPVHPFEHLPCLLELRPGAGGDEAALFAGDLLRMYQAFCKRHRLGASIISLVEEEGHGEQIQEAILEISQEGSYGILRCEAGVHRVQRVPATESKGRTHTSAVSVIVLPNFPPNAGDTLGASTFEDPSSDYYVDPKDVRTDVMRARGAGGQHVNTTDSAVRLTHIPTNTVVAVQEARSQLRNRERAWQILRARIAQARREAREAELAALRLGVVGVGRMGRENKVRTYNWGQRRVTDHRSGLTTHALGEVLDGEQELDDLMRSVRTWMVEGELEALAAEESLGQAKQM